MHSLCASLRAVYCTKPQGHIETVVQKLEGQIAHVVQPQSATLRHYAQASGAAFRPAKSQALKESLGAIYEYNLPHIPKE